jgi:hypothetical protein
MNGAEEPGVIEAAGAAHRTGAPSQPSNSLAPAARAGRERASGFQRARSVLNSALPLVERLLPLLDGNFASAALNLVAPRANPPAAQIDLGPIQRSLTEVQARQQKLSAQIAAQSLPLDQLRNQLVPELLKQVDELKSSSELTARNQEKMQSALDKIHRKFNRLAVAAVLLLAAILLANLAWLIAMRPAIH